MTRDPVRNMAVSVRQRLLHRARERGEDFQLVLTHYAVERFLYRLSRSSYADQFVLKGAMLFALWGGGPHRATRDLDLLGSGTSEIPHLEHAFREICTVPVEEDGIQFIENTVRGKAIREHQVYASTRIILMAHLDQARVQIQIDIGFGDVVTPSQEEVEFQAMLGFPSPRLKTYPRETVVAEKFQAMVMLGMANSRMRDFYDIWILAKHFPFNGRTLCEAIKATFNRRRTLWPTAPPMALTP